jgi:hypothetical protein
MRGQFRASGSFYTRRCTDAQRPVLATVTRAGSLVLSAIAHGDVRVQATRMTEPPLSVHTEGVHPEPRKTGHRLVDFSIAVSAILISLISLAVAIHHGRVQERLVAANSWPFLVWNTSIDQDARGQRFSIYIANSGVGPAILKGLVVRYRGKPVRGWVELLQECCGLERAATPDPPALGFFTGGQAKGVISAGETRTLISLLRLPQNPQLWERLMAARLQLTFDACYCSIVGECWKSDLRTLEQEHAAQCKSGPEDYREFGAGLDDKSVLPPLRKN